MLFGDCYAVTIVTVTVVTVTIVTVTIVTVSGIKTKSKKLKLTRTTSHITQYGKSCLKHTSSIISIYMWYLWVVNSGHWWRLMRIFESNIWLFKLIRIFLNLEYSKCLIFDNYHPWWEYSWYYIYRAVNTESRSRN